MIYKNPEKLLEEKTSGEVLYLSYPLIENTEIVKHGFSTRIGGVSKEHLSAMNLSFSRGDNEEAVRENFRRMANALGVSYDSFVFSQQFLTLVTLTKRQRI